MTFNIYAEVKAAASITEFDEEFATGVYNSMVVIEVLMSAGLMGFNDLNIDEIGKDLIKLKAMGDALTEDSPDHHVALFQSTQAVVARLLTLLNQEGSGRETVH